MIELFISMAALAVASYAVWISTGVTSCQRELKSFERRVNALCGDVMECQIKTDKLEHQAEKVAKLLDTMTQEIRGELSVTDVSVEELKVKLAQYQAEQQRMKSAMKENRDALVKWFEGEL